MLLKRGHTVNSPPGLKVFPISGCKLNETHYYIALSNFDTPFEVPLTFLVFFKQELTQNGLIQTRSAGRRQAMEDNQCHNAAARLC
jgi:hypothetical protein